MKKYGLANYMCDLVRLFWKHENKLTDQQKHNIENICCTEINVKYPKSAEWEVCK